MAKIVPPLLIIDCLTVNLRLACQSKRRMCQNHTFVVDQVRELLPRGRDPPFCQSGSCAEAVTFLRNEHSNWKKRTVVRPTPPLGTFGHSSFIVKGWWASVMMFPFCGQGIPSRGICFWTSSGAELCTR